MLHRSYLILLLLALPAAAAPPHADWRTIETAHYRVHYPAEYEAWSMRAASRLEAIREAVVAEVGYAPARKTDILIANPLAEANGLALPLLDTPRIVLFTEPPGPDEQIGEYSNWIDLLTVHEVAHQVHLARPSRNPTRRLLERFLPLSPITLGAPRWVLEGYATVVEGRLTGSGRPSGAMRAAILRKWAENGRLPTYGELNSDQRFLGMSMAYLVGSAYLEWLEARSGPGSLRKLWARQTARQSRSFDQAFEGVFGDRPSRLYGRFIAELNAKPPLADPIEGALWQETPRDSGEPHVSPDGAKIAVVLREHERPPRLVIWSTAPPTEEEEKLAKRIAENLKLDPEDVAPVIVKPLPRKPLQTFTPPDGGDLTSPRWMPDGKSILYTHRAVDRDGIRHRDLYRWTPGGANERVTHLADVGEADPFPDGRRAVAIRTRYGLSQLVTVDLQSGAADPITEPSLEIVYHHPRVSRDGRTIAYAAHGTGTWRLVRRDLATGRETASAMGNVATPEWSRTSDDVYATILAGGFIDIHRFGDDVVPVTRTSGAAMHPAPSPDGRLFFMSLEPDGWQLRVLESPTALSSATRDPRPATLSFRSDPLPSPRPYHLGRPEWSWIGSTNISPSVRTTELGARVGDLVGRLDALAIVDTEGSATIAAAWRGWPIALESQLFRARAVIPSVARDLGGVSARNRQPPHRSSTQIPSRARDATGLELRASWDGQWPRHFLTVDAGALTSDSKSLVFIDAAARFRQVRWPLRLSEELRLSVENDHIRAVARAQARLGGTTLAVQLQRDRGDVLVGGIAPSVVPRSFVADRVLDPALEAATLFGDDYTGLRAELTVGNVTAFWQQHRALQHLALAGVELSMKSHPQPLLKVPGFDLGIGMARLLDPPLEGRTRWWIAIRWRP